MVFGHCLLAGTKNDLYIRLFEDAVVHDDFNISSTTYLPNHHLVILPAFYALLWHSLMPSPGENTCTSPVLVTHLGHFFRIDVHICPTRREANTAIRVGVTKNSL